MVSPTIKILNVFKFFWPFKFSWHRSMTNNFTGPWQKILFLASISDLHGIKWQTCLDLRSADEEKHFSTPGYIGSSRRLRRDDLTRLQNTERFPRIRCWFLGQSQVLIALHSKTTSNVQNSVYILMHILVFFHETMIKYLTNF